MHTMSSRSIALNLCLLSAAFAQTAVLTQHNDTSRLGANLSETILNGNTVNVNQFGKLFSRSVDGQIYAQPLYVPNVALSGGRSADLVIVATEHNSVYAFDAVNPSASTPIWHVNLGPSVPSSAICTTDTYPEIGITSTPAIDDTNKTVYVVAKTVENGGYVQRLHSLDLLTGQDKVTPVVIQATVTGTGAGNTGGVISFDALHQHNRPGLLLLNGQVLLAFASHCDVTPYHGWVMAYDASNLTQTAVLNVTPNDTEGGIWHAGQGLAADANGYIYLITGNGGFDFNNGGKDLGDSFVKLQLTSSGFTIMDWFTPSNQATLNAGDEDLGSGGPVLLPPLAGTSSNLIIGGGKQGILYLLDIGSMGHYNTTADAVVQEFAATSGLIFGSPVLWSGPNGQQWLYLWGTSDTLKQYQWSNGKFNTTPVAASSMTAAMPGGILSISANGSAAGTGILWALSPVSNSAGHNTVAGILRAFDASNVSRVLWDSLQNSARDDFGNLAKFCPPTIANGRVYVATFSNQLVVYGGLTGTDAQAPSAPANLAVTGTTSTTVSLSWRASTDNVGVDGYNVYRTVQGRTTLAKAVSGTTYTDTGLSRNTNYSYSIKAYDAAGNVSQASNSVKAKTSR